MLIECPACHTRAKIPDSKEGAKVRCSNCERIYVAGGGGRGRSSVDPTRYVIIGGAVLVLAFVFYKINSTPRNQPEAGPPVEVEEETVVVDRTGWDSALVKLARELHEHARNGNEPRLREMIDGERVYERLNAPPTEEGGEVAGETPELEPWSSLGGDKQLLFLSEVSQRMTRGEDRELLVDWIPYTGAGPGGAGVVSESDDEAVLHLTQRHYEDASLADRHVEWRFVKRKGGWKAYAWERWFSPEELAAERVARAQKTTKRTLSDGSFVIEGEVRVLPYMDETPNELRTEIDGLVAKLVDLGTPAKELTKTRNRLEEIGKPAIPPLMSQLALIPLETQEQAIQLNMVCDMLLRITGYVTTFKPDESLGATAERRESGLKQWFGWYDRKFKKFVAKTVAEPTLEPIDDKERALLEKEQQEAELRKKIGLDGKK